MDGISIPHRFSALETNNADAHRTRFFGLNLFKRIGLAHKLITSFAFLRTVELFLALKAQGKGRSSVVLSLSQLAGM